MARSTSPTRLKVSLTLLASGALLLTACGGGSSGSGGSSGHIDMGVEGPMTGVYAPVGAGFWKGAQAAAHEINAEGGLLGKKLVLHQADDVSDPADALPAIRKLIDIDHIVALDGPNSTVLPAIEPILTSNKIPTMFQGGTTSFDTNTNNWIWRPSPSDAQLGVAMAAYALSKHYKSAAMMFSAAESAQTLSGVVEDTYKKNGGTIVSSVTIQPGATSYRSEVARVASSHPDVIFTQVDATTAGPLFNNLAHEGLADVPLIGSDLTAGGEFIKAIGPSVAHKVLTSIQGSTSSGPGVTTFEKFYGQLYSGDPISGANYSYDAIMELALAIQAANTVDPANVVAHVPTVSNPPGTDVSDWGQALIALKAHEKIHFVGAGGPAAFNGNHNALGSFAAFQANAAGVETDIGEIPVVELQQAGAGQLAP
jgi:branched-chain amino acid transport system substrate-binding protein